MGRIFIFWNHIFKKRVGENRRQCGWPLERPRGRSKAARHGGSGPENNLGGRTSQKQPGDGRRWVRGRGHPHPWPGSPTPVPRLTAFSWNKHLLSRDIQLSSQFPRRAVPSLRGRWACPNSDSQPAVFFQEGAGIAPTGSSPSGGRPSRGLSLGRAARNTLRVCRLMN